MLPMCFFLGLSNYYENQIWLRVFGVGVVCCGSGLLTVRKTDASSRITEYTRPLLLMNT